MFDLSIVIPTCNRSESLAIVAWFPDSKLLHAVPIRADRRGRRQYRRHRFRAPARRRDVRQPAQRYSRAATGRFREGGEQRLPRRPRVIRHVAQRRCPAASITHWTAHDRADRFHAMDGRHGGRCFISGVHTDRNVAFEAHHLGRDFHLLHVRGDAGRQFRHRAPRRCGNGSATSTNGSSSMAQTRISR